MVMAADDLGQRIAQHRQEVLVGVQHLAGEIELDHRLRLADRLLLAFEIGEAILLLGDVGRELDHADRLAAAPRIGL
jgi:hypothetical protein